MGMGAVALWLGFPNTVLHIPILVLAYPLALVLLGQHAHTAQEAFRKGWITGMLGGFAALYWLAIPIHNVGGLPYFLAIPCALFIGAYVGAYGGIFCASSWYITTKNIHSPAKNALILACIWYGLELLRGWLFTGFPWLILSSAFVPWPIFTQGAALMGSYALSALWVLIVLLALPFFMAVKKYFVHKTAITTQALHLAALSIMLFTSLTGYGFFCLEKEPIHTLENQDPQDMVRCIMIEGNVDQNIKWELHVQKTTLERYINLSRKALAKVSASASTTNTKNIPTLLIWPETAMPFYIERHPQLGPQLLRFAREIQTPFIVGAPGAIARTPNNIDIFNRAYLFNTSGHISAYYDKAHLVPFGEYVPSWLAWNFLEPLLQGIGTFTIGEQTQPLVLDKLALGMLICYEGIFMHLAQTQVAAGANILLNISNDGWFGDSAAAEQHLQLSIMRAIEQGRWLVRSTNTGISAIVDHKGRIRLQGAQFMEQSLTGLAKLQNKNTVFHRFYTYIPWIVLTIGILALFWNRPRNTQTL